MTMGKGFGGINQTFQSEEELAVNSLFPAKDKARRLQMITDLQPKAVIPLAVLGVIKRRFKSDVIAIFEDEFYSKLLSKDRKGRLELSEIFVARRAAKDEED